jgi:hypothetical protein
MAKKYGQIDFESVLIAAASGAIYTTVTNAVSNSKTKFSAKWNAKKDEYYTAGAAVAGFGLLYFLPKAKWSVAAGYGLIGASGAIAAQLIAKGKDDKGDGTTPPPAADDVVNGYGRKKLLNRANATGQMGGGYAARLMNRGNKPGRVQPNRYAAINNCDILGLN